MSTIFFAGAGSVMGKVAESVFRTSLDPRSGVAISRATILDRDVLEEGNLIRHEALRTDLGKPKTEFLRERLAGLAPGVELETIQASIHDGDALPRIEDAVAGSDLVLASFDNPPAFFGLNALCARFGRPLLASETISGAIGLWLHAACFAPDAPCFLCIARARHEDIQLDETPRERRDYSDPRALLPAARVPADDWGVTITAALLAREAVRALRAGAVDPATPPLRLIALERVLDPRIGGFFPAPLHTTVIPAPRLPDCPVCRARPVSEDEHARNLAFFEEGAA